MGVSLSGQLHGRCTKHTRLPSTAAWQGRAPRQGPATHGRDGHKSTQPWLLMKTSSTLLSLGLFLNQPRLQEPEAASAADSHQRNCQK